MWIAHAITFVMHGPLFAGVAFLVGAPWAALFCLALFVATAARLQTLVREGRRTRWETSLVDIPVFVHWAACLLSTFPLFPAFVLSGAIVNAVSGLGWGAVHVLGVGGLLAYGLAFVVGAYGSTLRRRWVRVVHVDVPIASLAPELDGYRIAQMSDLHIGNFDSKQRGLEWAAKVNRLEADLVAVTGDLVTSGTAFYEDVAEVIGAVRAKDGVFVSLGNHDQWNPDELTKRIEAHGPVVLRNQWRAIRRGAAELVVAGLDDRSSDRDDIEATLAGRPARAPTVLLSHYPDFFDEAAKRRVELTLSGHTHGGQIAVPFMAQRASLSTLARQTRPGLHQRGPSRLYVNAGLGTTGPPFRLGIPPEITVFVLRST
ncbi:MAG TPA: metallophosphoesterase [Polyangiaceae bacterium]|nr:metallophosphoesterase [Polyangiaceae bacterium]